MDAETTYAKALRQERAWDGLRAAGVRMGVSSVRPGQVGELRPPGVIKDLGLAGLENLGNQPKTMNSLLRAMGSHGGA